MFSSAVRLAFLQYWRFSARRVRPLRPRQQEPPRSRRTARCVTARMEAAIRPSVVQQLRGALMDPARPPGLCSADLADCLVYHLSLSRLRITVVGDSVRWKLPRPSSWSHDTMVFWRTSDLLLKMVFFVPIIVGLDVIRLVS